MHARSKLLAALLSAGVLASSTAARGATTTYYYGPATTDARTYYYVTEGPSYVAAPTPVVAEVVHDEPIVVEAPRLADDQRITDDVVHVLAHDPYLSGRIGVETLDGEVNLSGSVTTPGQVRRAVRNAKSVWGVRNVTSELRPRVGANTSY